MTGKILTVVFAVLAGAGAVIGYHIVMQNQAPPREEKLAQRIQVLEGELASLQKEVEAQGKIHQAAGTDVETLAARLNTADKQLSEIQEKQAQLLEAKPAGRITGDEIAKALKALPVEGRDVIRRTMRQDEQRTEREAQTDEVTREGLEREIKKAIGKLSDRLAMTPVQVEEARQIGEDFIETVLEAAQAAEERDDPTYAMKVRKEMERKVTRQIAQILTAEQLATWREWSDDIERIYPEGF